jgi:hypothetical protein
MSVASGAASWTAPVAVWASAPWGLGMPAVVGAAVAGVTGGLLWLTYLSESSAWFLWAGGGGAAASCAF